MFSLLKAIDTLSGEVTIKIVLPPFWKGVYFGSKFFPFRVNFFQKGPGLQISTWSHKSCLLMNRGENLQMYWVLLMITFIITLFFSLLGWYRNSGICGRISVSCCWCSYFEERRGENAIIVLYTEFALLIIAGSYFSLRDIILCLNIAETYIICI